MRDLEIFAQAIEIAEPEKRQHFILAACGVNLQLRASVEAMIEAYQKADGLDESLASDAGSPQLAQPQETSAYQAVAHLAPEAVEDSPSDAVVPLQQYLGPYRLLEKIGEGGFGEVFIAEQLEPIQRRVAIKIIKPGMDSREVIARFTAERQALALMDHPNIAKVLDAGTTSRGLPYFVMELVRGMTIIKYCDHAKLSIEERLQLFTATCRAIQHAHQKGIIHRDIKPSNVLVTLHDGKPVVKVIDFGVAKALNQRLTNMTIYTRFTFMVGTPAYMSPEQAEMSGLDIDTRSDIYSLGVLLYELITGWPPFQPERFAKASMDEMRRIIRDEDPPRPSMKISTLKDQATSAAQLRRTEPARLHTMMRGDLDWIVMKALAKDRTLRYDTANGLAADVQRYLNGDAIIARPPSWSYLASRFMRRNRGLVVSGSLVLTTLVLASVLSLWLAIWAIHEQRVAQRQELLAIHKSQEADSERQRAEKAELEAVGNLLESRLAFTELNLQSGRLGQQIESLQAIERSIELAQRMGVLDQHLVTLRSQAINALTRVDLKLIASLKTPREAARFYAFTGDFSKIAYRIRENNQSYITIRSLNPPGVELLRVPYPYDTQTIYHDEVVTLLSPDGRYLAAGNMSHGTMLWDLQRNQLICELNAGFLIRGTQFSRDSAQLAIVESHNGSWDRVNVYRLPEARIESSFQISNARTVSLAGNGKFIAVGGSSSLRLYEIATGERIADIPLDSHQHGSAISWSASENLLAVANNNQIQIWNFQQIWDAYLQQKKLMKVNDGAVTTPKHLPIKVLSGHESFVEKLHFHPTHESLLVSTSWDNTVRFWNVLTGSQQLMIPDSRPNLSSDGRKISISTAQGVDIYHTEGMDACRWIYGGIAQQIAFDPQTQWVGLGTDDGTRFWSLPGLQPIGQMGTGAALGLAWDSANNGLLVGNSHGVFEVPVALRSMSTESADSDASEPKSVLRLGPSMQLMASSVSDFRAVLADADGRWLVAGEANDWEPILLDRHERSFNRLHEPERYQSYAFSHRSKYMVSSHSNANVIRKLDTGKTIVRLPGMGNHPAAAFTPDDKFMMVTSSSGSIIMDSANWNVSRELPETIGIYHVPFANRSNHCALPVGPGEIAIYHTEDWKTVAKLNYTDPPRLFTFASFSPDDSYLAVTHANAAVVWDLRLIKSKLAELGIHWDGDGTPIYDSEIASPQVVKCELQSGDLEKLEDLKSIEATASSGEVAQRLKQMIDSGVELPYFWNRLADYCSELGEWDLACDYRHQAIQLAAYAETWRWNLAVDLQEAFRFKEAFQEFQVLADPDRSNRCLNSFEYLCCIASAYPEAITDPEALRAQLDHWQQGLENRDLHSSYAAVIRRLKQEQIELLWQAIGMAHFGLGQYDRAQEILEQHSEPLRRSSRYIRAALDARAGRIERSQAHLKQAVDEMRENPHRTYSQLDLHFYSPVAVLANQWTKQFQSMQNPQSPESSEQLHFPQQGRWDSLDLGLGARATQGKLFVAPTPQSIDPSKVNDGNVLYWDLRKPTGELQISLPVPGPGQYKLDAKVARAFTYGDYQIVPAAGTPGIQFSAYRPKPEPGELVIVIDEAVDLGVVEAKRAATSRTVEDQGWILNFTLRCTGRNPNSLNYNLSIDDILWTRVD
jgi:serine/threonine protein kinase/tetratricopeptide (TPR) repeat protein